MTNKNNKTSSYCYACQRKTNHQILHDTAIHDNDGYISYNFQIICCLGCDYHAFRLTETNLHECYQDEFGEWQCDSIIEKIYPKQISPKFDIWLLPKTVHSIYLETLLAIQEDLDILAAIGLRATLEAICQDKKLSGHNLDKKIEQLFLNGFITERNANFLHSVRFLGNDAAHEIVKAEKHQIQAALKMIEYLIESTYILEEQIAGNLPDIYERFLEKLKNKVENIEGKFSLSNLFSEEGIFKKQLAEFNTKLIKDIENKKIDFIQVTNDTNLPFETVQKTITLTNE